MSRNMQRPKCIHITPDRWNFQEKRNVIRKKIEEKKVFLCVYKNIFWLKKKDTIDS